jgi:hypothetical protein
MLMQGGKSSGEAGCDGADGGRAAVVAFAGAEEGCESVFVPGDERAAVGGEELGVSFAEGVEVLQEEGARLEKGNLVGAGQRGEKDVRLGVQRRGTGEVGGEGGQRVLAGAQEIDRGHLREGLPPLAQILHHAHALLHQV